MSDNHGRYCGIGCIQHGWPAIAREANNIVSTPTRINAYDQIFAIALIAALLCGVYLCWTHFHS